ncbi:MAG: BamA/TamA family outer membrane protein [Bacteroidetes bacterium]|nr:BamA/TamA family outer membrane protein [Bacteroidota bacterium]
MSLQAKIFTFHASFLKRKRIYFLSAVFFLFSCNVTKKLEPGQYLLEKVEIRNTKETKIEKENFEAFIRQKPNRKLFRVVDFYVWWYNQFDATKIKRKKELRNLKYDKHNADKVKRFEALNTEREKKGKKPRIPKLKDKESQTFLESVRDIGEAPVILDSALTEQTRNQLSKYLFSKGFFNNKVADSVKVDAKRKKAFVNYHLIPKSPYVIGGITYQMDDSKLGELILKDTLKSILKRGMIYDTEKFQEERQRITNLALNNGYFYFENAYLKFDIDSNYNNRSISVKLILKKFSRPYTSTNDSLVYVNHTKFKIENVYVITEPVTGNLREAPFKDTLRFKKTDVLFLQNKPLAYRPSVIYSNIDIHQAHLFRKDTAEITYKALLGLGIFKNVTIQFLKSVESSSKLDCYIVCLPLIKQSITAETEGINTSGNLGVDGSLIYQNKNIFKGGELFEIKLQGAFIAQQQFNDEKNPNLNEIQKTFNTLQFGPEATFSVPRAFFPFSLFPFRKEMAPHTFVRSSVNYQARPEFSRVITDINYGFNFKTYNNRLKHELVPFQAYLVRANLNASFRDYLSNLHDAFLLNSFQDHITTISKYAVTYTSKENTNTSKRAVSYVRLNLQSSGNILRQYFISSGAHTDSLGRYLIFGIPFAQFLRADIDYRIYIPVRKKSRIVYRLAGGIGKPLANLGVLPYEQSFFSGGPNSIRAWRARTLGPGGYDPRGSSAKYDKIGDMLLEGNFEYRFHIIKSFNGAIFADAGNIWRLDKDENKPNAEFLVDQFYKQIAVGGGMGIRWDLSFFVLRVDLAVPLRDPKYQEADRWTFNKRPYKEIVFNFGIGYPF